METQNERERRGRDTGQSEKQAPCREPDMGLDPESPESHPGLQAVLNRCATRAALKMIRIYNLHFLPMK